MLSTFPIPIAPVDDGDCDMMMQLCTGDGTQASCTQGESLQNDGQLGHKI